MKEYVYFGGKRGNVEGMEVGVFDVGRKVVGRIALV